MQGNHGYPRSQGGIFTGVRRETVWKVPTGLDLEYSERPKEGENVPSRPLEARHTGDQEPSAYFPDSLSTHFVNEGEIRKRPTLVNSSQQRSKYRESPELEAFLGSGLSVAFYLTLLRHSSS